MTDQLERVRSLLKKVTYKPGWKITATETDRWSKHQAYLDQIYLTIVCPQPNLEGGIEPVMITRSRAFYVETIAQMKDGDIINHLIGRCIIEMEMHEMDEWFKFDGFHVRDPHPESNSKKKLDKQLTTV